MKKLLNVLFITCALLAGCTSTPQKANIKDDSMIVDTTKPKIIFFADSVTVETGSKYSATENIKSVTDDTDGTLTQVKQASKGAAYYLVDDSRVDTSKVGEYSVIVTAVDKTGNTATKSFKVVVKDAEKKETAKTEAQTETKSDSKKAATASKTESKSTTASTKKTNSNASSAKSSSSSGTAASNSSSTAKKEHTHSWTTVHHDATGHYETTTVTDKESYDEWIFDGYECLGCGKIFMDVNELTFHDCDHSVANTDTSTDHEHSVHHDAVTHQSQVWVVDSNAYDETVCSTCGAKQ